MADNRAQFRKDGMTESALEKAKDKWPKLSESERYRRMIEQWLYAQDAGTSKTQKIADMATAIEAMSEFTGNLAEDLHQCKQILIWLQAHVGALETAFAEHGIDIEDVAHG